MAPRPVEGWVSAVLESHEGSFSQAGRKEAILIVSECGPRGTASAFLVSWRAAKWHYERDLGLAQNCQKTRIAGGRDVLVCEGLHTSGHSVGQWVHVIDAARAEPDVHLTRMETQKTAETGVCEGYVPPLLSGYLGTVELRDVNADGFDDLVIPVEYVHLSLAETEALRAVPDYKAACECHWELELATAELKPGCACPALALPEKQSARLEFLHRNGTFEPTQATRVVLDEIERRE